MFHHEPESQINRKVVQKMRRKIICPERAGSNWESDEITLLTREFRKGTELTKIALMLRRTEMEVVRLIEKMDLYRLLDCRPGRKAESPLCTGCPWKEECSGPDWNEFWNNKQGGDKLAGGVCGYPDGRGGM